MATLNNKASSKFSFSYATTCATSVTQTSTAPPLSPLTPRTDLCIADQRRIARYHQQLQGHDIATRQYERTKATVDKHICMVKCLLNEAQRYQLAALKKEQEEEDKAQGGVNDQLYADNVAVVENRDAMKKPVVARRENFEETQLPVSPRFCARNLRTEEFQNECNALLTLAFPVPPHPEGQGPSSLPTVVVDNYPQAVSTTQSWRLFKTRSYCPSTTRSPQGTRPCGL